MVKTAFKKDRHYARGEDVELCACLLRTPKKGMLAKSSLPDTHMASS